MWYNEKDVSKWIKTLIFIVTGVAVFVGILIGVLL